MMDSSQPRIMPANFGTSSAAIVKGTLRRPLALMRLGEAYANQRARHSIRRGSSDDGKEATA